MGEGDSRRAPGWLGDVPRRRVGLSFWVPLWRRMIAALRVGSLVGFMLPFDRVLDMIRTAADYTSDLVVATLVARWENEMDVEVFKSVRDV